MQIPENISDNVRSKLGAIYEEVMWLAQRPNVTPSSARAWYTHIAHLLVRRDIRMFTGKVSRKAATDEAALLRLEHFKRIQTTLTKLVDTHLQNKVHNPQEFINTVIDCEQVHVVTVRENYDAQIAKGNYIDAGIELLDWHEVPKDRRITIWKNTLRGKVANAGQYRVEP